MSVRHAYWRWTVAAAVVSIVVCFIYEYALRATANRHFEFDRFLLENWRLIGIAAPVVASFAACLAIWTRLGRSTARRALTALMISLACPFFGLAAWVAACPWVEECV